MGLQRQDGLGQCVHDQRPRAQPTDRIDQQRQRRDVIEMRMRQEYMIDGRQFLDAQVLHAGARVHQDVVIDEKRGRASTSPDPAATSQYAHLH